MPDPQAYSDPEANPQKDVSTPVYPELRPRETGVVPTLQNLLGVRFEVEAVLGRVVLPIEEILKLGTGAVIELDRSISDPVDLMVQGVCVARGEVVVVDDAFGIRIKEISQPRR